MRKLLLFFLLIPSLVFSQNNGTFKAVRFVNVLDSTTVMPVNGSIYYNEQSNKFRVYENNAWHDLLGGGGGGGSVDFGSPGQIPFTNSTSDNFDYNSNLSYDGSDLYSTSSLLGGLEGAVSSFYITPTLAQFNDNRASTIGITYEADFSSDFTDRSLADWGNVLRNGYTTTLNGNTTIDITDQNFLINGIDNGLNTTFDVSIDYNAFGFGSFAFNINPFVNVGLTHDNGTVISTVNVGGPGGDPVVNLNVDDAGTTNDINFSVRSAEIRVEGGSNFQGIQYQADYSSNYIDRSLVDREYNNSHLIGATTPPAPTVTQNGQSLRWNDSGNTWEYFTAGGAPTLTDTQVAFGSGTNTITSESEFNYNATANRLSVFNAAGTQRSAMQGDRLSLFDASGTNGYQFINTGIISSHGTATDIRLRPSGDNDVRIDLGTNGTMFVGSVGSTAGGAQVEIVSEAVSETALLVRTGTGDNAIEVINNNTSGQFTSTYSGRPGGALAISVDGPNNAINLGDLAAFSAGISIDVANGVISITADSGTNTIYLNSGGEIIFQMTRTNCTGAPSGALANVGGTLTVCP